MTVKPIIIGALGTTTKWLVQGLEDLEIGGRVETICYIITHIQMHMQYICNTKHRQIQADSVVSSMNTSINPWPRTMATRGERHNSYYAEPTPNARSILRCPRYPFISAGRDPENSTAAATVENSTLCLNGRNSTLCFHGPISTDSFSKSSNSQDHLFRAWHHPHSSPISCLRLY